MAKQRKVCPQCGASVFQGPYHRGEILDGKFQRRETIYQCMSCHAVLPEERLVTREIENYSELIEASQEDEK